MASVLISGGAGFLGSHLANKLISENYRVICMDNLITGNKQNVFRLLDNPNFEFIEKDVINSSSCLPDRFGEINYIFHLASPASPNSNSPRSYMNLPVETLLANSQGTYNLLELARAKNAKFLYASTSEVYGNPSVSPQPETYFGNVNPNGIRSVYDESKRYGEAITFAYLRKFDLDVRIIRIFNTYGPRMQKDDGRVVSNFINQALQNLPITVYGDGHQTRSFCFVNDLVDGISAAMIKNDTKGEVINLGNPDERTISEIAEIVKKLTNSKSSIVNEERPDDDPQTRKPDISKAQKILNWKPSVNLETGLIKTIEYFRNL